MKHVVRVPQTVTIAVDTIFITDTGVGKFRIFGLKTGGAQTFAFHKVDVSAADRAGGQLLDVVMIV